MNNLHRQTILERNADLVAYIGDRDLRVFKKLVDGSLNHGRLSELVKRDTGRDPRLDSAYLFFLKNNAGAKVLIKNLKYRNIMICEQCQLADIKALLFELEIPC